MFGWFRRDRAPDTKRNTRLFEDEVLTRLSQIERRLGQIEEDGSAVRRALVETRRTQDDHLRSHDEDGRRRLRLAVTQSEQSNDDQ